MLLAGIAALNRVRMEIPLEKENQEKLVKFMIRIGVFSVLYLVPLLTVLACYLYENSYRRVWETTWVQEKCRDYHIPCPYQVEQTSRPDLALFLIKYLMMLIVGIPSVFWVGSKKTCFEWASFFHGKKRKDAMVNESRQVLQEPDFTALLLRDPNTPIVRKSRGTSTQGTSTHASSTHLAMDEPHSNSTSRAGSVRSGRSKLSSYHGSLHRSRDGRYTASSFRAADERLPYGSLPRLHDSRHCSNNRLDSSHRLDDMSRYDSSHRLESQSRHSSIRDLTTNTQVLSAPGNGIHRVMEEDGTAA